MTSPSPIEQFLTHRGVLAKEPDQPRETYPEYWSRSVRWRAAAHAAPSLVSTYGAEKAREVLNTAIGQPAYFNDARLIPQLGHEGRYGFILLPGGCYWALLKDVGGQCAFCEFQETVDEVAGNLPFSNEEFMNLFDAGLATMTDHEIINIFTAGSFLNPGEIPMEVQAYMTGRVAETPGPAILRVESRVQYMVPETIEPLVRILKSVGKTLDIAIGFETQDDYLRNKVLRKGMGRAGFADGVRAAKNAGARVSVYVMLMPCDMTEGFALKECEESVRVAFQAGADEVLVQARYSHHDHVKCPTLWTITELLSRVAQLGPVMLGRWETELPTPVVWPKNCPSCTPAVMDAIVQYRNTLSPQCIAPENLPDCECRKDWEEAIKDVSPPQKVDDTKRHLPTV